QGQFDFSRWQIVAAIKHLEVRVGQLIAILRQVGEFVDQSLEEVDRAPKVSEGWLRADVDKCPGTAPGAETVCQILAVLGEGRRPVGQLFLAGDGGAKGFLRIPKPTETCQDCPEKVLAAGEISLVPGVGRKVGYESLLKSQCLPVSFFLVLIA